MRYVHTNGFLDYWQRECLPQIQRKCEEFEEFGGEYPVIEEVNKLLGFQKVKKNFITLYLCNFVAPYGIGLNEAFISDIRWNFEDTVAIAVHELIHAPFSREKIREITPRLWEDPFVKEAKSRLSASSGYHLPEMFIEENLVEGTHIYLSERLGVEKDPLKFLIDHDSGSHVVSVILYDALKRGYRDETSSIEEAVYSLIAEGTLAPGNIRGKYLEIMSAAGMGDDHPYQQEPDGFCC